MINSKIIFYFNLNTETKVESKFKKELDVVQNCPSQNEKQDEGSFLVVKKIKTILRKHNR